MSDELRLRPLEREDLRFVHELDNNETVMHYWFEEPYEAFVELCDLYDKHIHDQSERRFIAEQGQVEIGCDFCGEHYHFDPIDAGELFTEGVVTPPGSTRLQ